jgi:hypothetical protein
VKSQFKTGSHVGWRSCSVVVGSTERQCQSCLFHPTRNALTSSFHQQTGQYYNFSNIRFGAAPTGDLRFSAPIAPQGRNRTVNDGQTAVICPQADPAWLLIAEKFLAGVPLATLINESSSSSGSLNLSDLPTPDPRTSEDCLFLDVVVPNKIFNNQRWKQKRNGYNGG